jgi:thiol-disulfide isomerase/thioredoxin
MKYRGVILFTLLVVGLFLILLSQKGRVLQAPKVAEGLEVPSFKVVDKNGVEYTKENLRGKTVFLHFWASWCKECRNEMPEIVKLYERKKSDPDFVFLGVIYREDPIKARKYLQENGYDLPIFVDPDENTAKAFGVTGVPETYIIGPDGVLEKKVIGPLRWGDFPI